MTKQYLLKVLKNKDISATIINIHHLTIFVYILYKKGQQGDHNSQFTRSFSVVFLLISNSFFIKCLLSS